MKKKLAALFLSILIGIASVTTVFADNVTRAMGNYQIGKFQGWFMVYPEPGSPYTLNVARNQPIPQNLQKITIWDVGTPDDQFFTVQYSSKDNRPRFYSMAGYDERTRTGYCFNMNTSNYGVMLYNDSMDDYRDAEVDLWTKSHSGNVCYNITLPNRVSGSTNTRRCVTVRNATMGSQVYWDGYIDGSIDQYWYCL